MSRELCAACGRRPRVAHFNAKYCLPCREQRLRQPRSSLSEAQKAYVRAWRPVEYGRDQARALAEELGVSRASVRRYCRDIGKSLRLPRYSEHLQAEVLAYYERHGRLATEDKFPTVRVRSLVERRPHASRQVRWTPDEIILAARMGGLIPADIQAEFFGRPNAGAGSIRSLWMKRFGFSGGALHGMHPARARFLLRPGFPTVVMPGHWRPSAGARTRHTRRRLVLWCDMGPWLLPGLPPFFADAVAALAHFQRWLFAPEPPGEAIRGMLDVVR